MIKRGLESPARAIKKIASAHQGARRHQKIGGLLILLFLPLCTRFPSERGVRRRGGVISIRNSLYLAFLVHSESKYPKREE